MKQRWRTIELAAAAVLAAALLFRVLHPSEPSYEGRRLSEWLRDFGSRQPNDTEEPERQARQAAEAIRHLGTNCLPVLLKMIQVRDSVVKDKLTAWTDRHSFIKFNFTSAEELRNQALDAFAALGPVARPAIPELTVLLNRDQHDPYIQYAAAGALARIGPETIPPLAAALTNRSSFVRVAAISALGYSKLPGREVIPLLVQGLRDAHPDARRLAARSLGRWTDLPELSVPALIQATQDNEEDVCHLALLSLGQYKSRQKNIAAALVNILGDKDRKSLAPFVLEVLQDLAPNESELLVPAATAAMDDPDFRIRSQAVSLLGRCGPRARSAVPSLLRLFNNGDEQTRQAVGAALLQVDPPAAASLGVTNDPSPVPPAPTPRRPPP